jgi:hypothetical protein
MDAEYQCRLATQLDELAAQPGAITRDSIGEEKAAKNKVVCKIAALNRYE